MPGHTISGRDNRYLTLTVLTAHAIEHEFSIGVRSGEYRPTNKSDSGDKGTSNG